MAWCLRAAVLAALCCAAFASGPGGIGPSWYECNPTNCSPPECVCASWAPPAVNGTQLAPNEIPQFILFTHDDAINQNTNQAVRSIIDQHKNRNGCNMPATFFVLEVGTDCMLARTFWEQNSEIAIHSKTHLPLTQPFALGPEGAFDEMFHARTFLNESCGIPLEDMVGYRAPQLVHNPPMRANLEQEGFLYDSSILEFYEPGSPTSPNASHRLWPYTMDAGIPQDCTYFQGDNCTQAERYPGLWEVPLLETQGANGSLLYSMDPGRDVSAEYGGATNSTGMPADQLQQLITMNFNKSYNGNRAPYGLYVHTPWVTNESVKATNDFLDYALALPDTYVVTVRQLIEWMQDPVPVSQMDEWLKCQAVDLSKSPGTTKCQVYTAKNGDYGELIASEFGVFLSELQALNPKLGQLQVGDTVLIPPFDSTCGAGVPVTAAPDVIGGTNLAAAPGTSG